MMEFIMTLGVIALIFVTATIMVALVARALLKLRREPLSSSAELTKEPLPLSSNLRICARNTPWP